MKVYVVGAVHLSNVSRASWIAENLNVWLGGEKQTEVPVLNFSKIVMPEKMYTTDEIMDLFHERIRMEIEAEAYHKHFVSAGSIIEDLANLSVCGKDCLDFSKLFHSGGYSKSVVYFREPLDSHSVTLFQETPSSFPDAFKRIDSALSLLMKIAGIKFETIQDTTDIPEILKRKHHERTMAGGMEKCVLDLTPQNRTKGSKRSSDQ